MLTDLLLHSCCKHQRSAGLYPVTYHQQEQELATILNRGPLQYQAQVRRKGYPTQTKTFETKKAAEKWATSVENEMNRGSFVDRSELEATTFGELLDRYAVEVTSAKRGRETEMVRIRALKKHPLAARTLASLRSMDFANYRNERLKTCCPATVKRELVIISHVFTHASSEWSLPVGNPLAGIAKPREKDHRERRLRDDEESRLLEAAHNSRAATLSFCIVLAIETGMRAGEIVKLRWEQIDLANHTIRLNLTKNGHARSVPLSERAEAAIRALPRSIHGGRLTSFYDSRGLSAAFRRACEQACIVGLRFHDLRHEAASRLAPHMPASTLAKVMGWKTLQMAMRYYNPTDQELVTAVRKVAPHPAPTSAAVN